MQDDDSKIIRIKKEQLVPKELNIDFGCFFYPNEKKIYTQVRTFTRKVIDKDGNIREASATINPAPKNSSGRELGILNTFDERILYSSFALFFKYKQPDLCVFSSREITEILDTEWSGQKGKAITDSFFRLATCFIVWEESFYLKKENRWITIKKPFTFLSDIEIRSNKEEGIGSAVSSFKINEHILKNFKNYHSRPTSFSNIKSFKSSLAQSVYNILEKSLFCTNDYSISSKKLLLDDIQLIGSSYKQKKHRVQRLKKIIPELIGLKLPYGETITEVFIEEGENGDAIFRVRRTGAKNLNGKILKTTDHKKKSGENKTEIPSDVRKVIAKFSDHFGLEHSIKDTPPTVVQYAQECIEQYGLKAVLFAIGHAKANPIQKNYSPKTFKGLQRNIPRGVEAYKAQLQVNERKQEVTKQHKQSTRELNLRELKTKYGFNYNEYVLATLENIQLSNPKVYKDFLNYETNKLLQQTSKFKYSEDIERIKKHINRTETHVQRIREFFNSNSEYDIQISSFEGWYEYQKLRNATANDSIKNQQIDSTTQEPKTTQLSEDMGEYSGIYQTEAEGMNIEPPESDAKGSNSSENIKSIVSYAWKKRRFRS